VGRKLGIAAAVLIALIGLIVVYLYNRIATLESEKVTDAVHVIFGVGGNTAVLETETGVVVVDTMTFPLQGRRIRDLAERLGGGPTQAIVNTHYHVDHTHGNPAWATGTRIVSTDLTLAYLDHFDGAFWNGVAAGSIPNETFEDTHEMRIGGKTIRSYRTGRGHTGGDLVVLFVEDRVLHTGDLFFHRIYPNIDLEAGGSVREWAATLDRVLALDFDRVIPGHGAVTDRAPSCSSSIATSSFDARGRRPPASSSPSIFETRASPAQLRPVGESRSRDRTSPRPDWRRHRRQESNPRFDSPAWSARS
jgi:glyoxylase-like metal-dependent hydrolase (beta-lactamase superfamily II)